MIDSIAVHLNATTSGFPEERAWADRFMNWLKSLKNKVQPQSKQEWSEEDERNLYYWLDNNKSIGNDKYRWLLSLKDRVQPKQEWSEEDKYLIYNIEQDYRGKLYDNPPESLRPYYNKVINLLKSLRLQNTWKPSDEQMLAINTAINVLGKGTINGKYLIELQEQLKKLREE